LYRWLDEYKRDGKDAFPGKGNLKPADEELRRLKRENKELREENEILKKAAAIFAKHQK
jgi:transposase